MRRFSLLLCCITLFFTMGAYADENIVNVYAWSGVIPDTIIRQFEHETGIKVNFSTYDSNETLYAKLRANSHAGYDVIEPSSYYVDRMRRQHMLESLNQQKIVGKQHLNPALLNKPYDPNNRYSIPFIWGVTGIFINKHIYPNSSIHRWADVWDKEYANQLMLLNDAREVFSIALKTLGYSANDDNPAHIQQAYLQLKKLMPNIKLFNSDAVISILIDEDANIGMAWNGDLFKAQKENANLDFVFPADGFVIWVDNFSIPVSAPHKDNAYRFLNFMLQPDVAKAIALDNNYPTANLTAQHALPDAMKNNPIAYPSTRVLRRGEFQMDIDDNVLAVYERYWEALKMSGD